MNCLFISFAFFFSGELLFFISSYAFYIYTDSFPFPVIYVETIFSWCDDSFLTLSMGSLAIERFPLSSFFKYSWIILLHRLICIISNL